VVGIFEDAGLCHALWVKVLCAATMAVGTAAGGWRIIRTLGHRVGEIATGPRLRRRNQRGVDHSSCEHLRHSAFPRRTSSQLRSMGVGAVKRFSGMRWTVSNERLGLDLYPARTALLGYLLERITG